MPSIYDHVASGGDLATYAVDNAADVANAMGSTPMDPASVALAQRVQNGVGQAIIDPLTLPRDVMAGRVDPQSDQGIARTLGMASLMGSGLPMAEKGAVGAMGGKALTGTGHIGADLDALIASAGKKPASSEVSIADQMNALLGKAPTEDPFAAMHASLDAQGAGQAAPRTMAESGVADPSAASWRLYHGTTDPTWDTFDPERAGLRTSGAERGAFFMSPREGEAASYATGDRSRILPLTVTPGNTGVYDVGQLLATRDPRFMAASRAEFTGSQAGYDAALKRYDADVAYHQDLRSRMPADLAAEMPDYPAASNLLNPQSAAISMARADGRDTAILRGLGESSGGDQVVALRPGFVRDATTGRLVYSGGLPIPGSAPALPSNALMQAAQPGTIGADEFNRLLAAGRGA